MTNRLANRLGLKRFAHEEDGALVVFGLFIAILMVAATGTAIDLMRYETKRVQLQYTLDRAVLAATALNQTSEPKDVVIDYFAKAGLQNYTLDIDVEEALNYRRVTASSNLTLDSFFLHMMGIEEMTAPARGQAEERIMNIEISMVLDISGSMGGSSANTTKLALMKQAANEFIDTVLPPSQSHLVNVSIIPYNGKVNAGTLVDAYFPLTNEHDSSSCTRFSEEQFTRTNLQVGETISRIGHFDRNSGNDDDMDRPHCQTDDYGAILPWSNNTTKLKAKVNSLNAQGWTAIDLGMKWASLLLDPSTNTILQAMNTDDEVEDYFITRPARYDDHETMKVVVIMTDGENTNQYDLRDEFKSGLSNVWVRERSNGDDRYSVYLPDEDKFLWKDDPDWNGRRRNNPRGNTNAVRLTYPELWARYPIRYVRDTLYQHAPSSEKNWIGGAAWQYGWRTNADDRLQANCQAAKDQGMVIFAIGFEAPYNGRNQLQQCASTDSHFYDVNGIEITDAFRAIARTINQLKLTQ